MDTLTVEEKPERSGLRKAGIALVVVMLILAGGWILLQYIGPYSSLRRVAIHHVGIERLQNWAVSVLDHPPEKFASWGPEGRMRPEDVPSDIQSLGENGLIVYVPSDVQRDIVEHILFACGGGFYHYGIRVGGQAMYSKKTECTAFKNLLMVFGGFMNGKQI